MEKSIQFRKAIVWTGQWGAGQLGHDRVKKKRHRLHLIQVDSVSIIIVETLVFFKKSYNIFKNWILYFIEIL